MENESEHHISTINKNLEQISLLEKEKKESEDEAHQLIGRLKLSEETVR